MSAGVVAGRRNRLREELDRQGIKPIWFAREMGVSNVQLCRYGYGDRTPPPGWRERAARRLGVHVEVICPDAVEAAIRPEPEAPQVQAA